MDRGGGLVVTAAARCLKRQVGPTAWAVLEDVLFDAEDEGGRAVAETNVRRLAKHLGITKDTAARALTRLIDAGLLTREQLRDSRGFARSHYVVDLQRIAGVTFGESSPTQRLEIRDSLDSPCPTEQDSAWLTSQCPQDRDIVVSQRPTNRDAEPPEDVPPNGGRRRRPSRRSSIRERPAQNALFDVDGMGVEASSGSRSSGTSTRSDPESDPETESALRDPHTTPATKADSNLSRATTSRDQIENLVNPRPDAITATLDNLTTEPFTHWHPAVPPVPSTGGRQC